MVNSIIPYGETKWVAERARKIFMEIVKQTLILLLVVKSTSKYVNQTCVLYRIKKKN